MRNAKLKFSMIVGTIASMALLGFIFFGAAGLTPDVAQAQPATEVAPPPRTITVVGEGTTSIEPDLARVNIGVMVTGNEVQATSADAQETMNQVIEAVKAQGVDDNDIQTSGFNIYANQPQPFGPADQGAANETTYQVSNNVTVIVRDLENVSTVLDAAIEAGANNIYGVNFSLADYSAPESVARSDAMENAQAKAEEIAGLAGVELGDVVSVSEVIGNQGGFYSARQDALAMGGGGPIEAGQLEVRVQLQVVYSIQ
jgi:uncharacterized protein YggE